MLEAVAEAWTTLWAGPPTVAGGAVPPLLGSVGVVAAVEDGDAVGLSVAAPVSVDDGPGEVSPDDKEPLGDAVSLLLNVVGLALAPVPAVFAELRTIEPVGTEAHVELESAIDACAAKELTSSAATPKNASPIAAPPAAGLRSSALTVHPRFKEPV